MSPSGFFLPAHILQICRTIQIRCVATNENASLISRLACLPDDVSFPMCRRFREMKSKASVRVLSGALFVVAALVTVVGISYGSTENASAPQYHLVKKVLLGGDGGWDYFTVDPATHRIFIGRGTYVMVLDQDGNSIGKVEVG